MISTTIDTLLRELLVKNGLNNERGTSTNTKLGEDGLGLDSLAILDLLLAIEQAFGVRLRDEGLTSEALSTVGGLTDYVETLKLG